MFKFDFLFDVIDGKRRPCQFFIDECLDKRKKPIALECQDPSKNRVRMPQVFFERCINRLQDALLDIRPGPLPDRILRWSFSKQHVQYFMNQIASLLRRQPGSHRVEFGYAQASVCKRRKWLCYLALHGICAPCNELVLLYGGNRVICRYFRVMTADEFDCMPTGILNPILNHGLVSGDQRAGRIFEFLA